MRQSLAAYAFNRGLVSALALGRADQKRVALSASTMTNWIPRILGPMSLRPGWEYIGSTYTNAAARFLPFVFAIDDTALLELTDSLMRVWVGDELVTRASVATAVTNGTFDTNLTGWTDSDEVGGTSAWVTGGYMGLTGDGTNYAIRDQTLTVALADQAVEHALRIVIQRGPVTLRVGSTSGGDEYITEATLGTGTHSLAFTPSGASVYVRFKANSTQQVLVDSVAIESSGVMTLPTPWPASVLSDINIDQSADVVFVACRGYQQRRIERRATRSWSVALYAPEDGPYRTENVGATTLTPSANTGNITLTASAALFRSGHVGSLWSIESSGQVVEASISSENTFTSAIEVTGIGSERNVTLEIAGTFVATVKVQRSFDSSAGPWINYPGLSYTAPTLTSFNDTLDNQRMWYRIGINTGDYTSGTADVTLSFPAGSIRGVVRITDYTSATSVSAEVLSDLGGTDATAFWSEGVWSDYRGWPSAVAFHDGRLWWAGNDKIIGSVSDAYDDFNPETEGDSGPINRSIGSGPVDTIHWMLSMQQLMLGAQGAVWSARSSSLDEPLTPTNFNLKRVSTQGAAAAAPAIIDTRAAYTLRGAVRVHELKFGGESYAYESHDLTTLVPELADVGIVRMAVQRQPDTRIHCVLNDGTVMLGVYDAAEDVLAWVNVNTDGDIEDVVVLPSQPNETEDAVYYVVKRTISGSTVRYLEKWALESECRGGTLNKQADAFITIAASAARVVSGLGHLEGKAVVVWAAGADIGTTADYDQTYTVSGGQITIDADYSNIVVGLPYTAQWKSSKLGAQLPSGALALTRDKRVQSLGLILAWVHPKGLRYGPDFNNLDDMPEIEAGRVIDQDAVRTAYDENPVEFPGIWEADARLCLQAQAPRPCTVLAAVADTWVS